MSSTLQWFPKKREGASLPTSLKLTLRKRYPGGSIDTYLNYADLPYLEALRDMDMDGAQALIDAITIHGEIEIKEMY